MISVRKVFTVIVLLPTVLFSQESNIFGKTIWETSMDAGFYFGNSYNAAYFNGNPENENNINFILKNPFHYSDIYNRLDVSDTFFLHGLPERMKYDPTISIGLGATRVLKNDVVFDFKVSYARLTASDAFTLEIDPGSILAPKRINFYSIWGREERYNIDIGARKFLAANDYISWFFGGGFNFNNTKVMESKIRIEDIEYSMVNVYLNQNYVPGASLMEYDIQQGGIGYGGYATSGLRFKVNHSFSMETTLTYYHKKINLYGYPLMKGHFSAFVRLCFAVVFEEEPGNLP